MDCVIENISELMLNYLAIIMVLWLCKRIFLFLRDKS